MSRTQVCDPLGHWWLSTLVAALPISALFTSAHHRPADASGPDTNVRSEQCGGVMGKMVDAQSIVIATAATNRVGIEGKIFRYIFWHSGALVTIVGAYAYVSPGGVPHGLTFVR